MAVSFFFDWSWIFSVGAWLFFILPVTAYIFLIIGCLDLKKDERDFESVKFLSTVGIILLTWRIIVQFLPGVIFSPSYPDLLIGFSYVLTLWTIGDALYIIFGISFIQFGRKNKEHKGSLSLSAGILFALARILSLIFLDIIYLVDFLLDPPFIILPPVMYLAFSWIIIILSLVAAILILVNTIFIKRVFMIIFAAILLSLITLHLVDLAGII